MGRLKLCVIVFLLIWTVIFLVIAFNSFDEVPVSFNPKTHLYSAKQDLLVDIKDRIVDNVLDLEITFKTPKCGIEELQAEILEVFKPKRLNRTLNELWKMANNWPKLNVVYPRRDPVMGEVIYGLQNADLIKVNVNRRGTQLKLLMTLTGNQTVIFKPQWYARDQVIEGAVYNGNDRHNAEIFAFYLGAILRLPWTPIAVGRQFDLRNIYKISTPSLRNTFLINETSHCFYGECFYCNASKLVCASAENNYQLEGVLLYKIPGKFELFRSPWQRTYNFRFAEWQKDEKYCEKFVKKKLSETRILDVVDGAVFDFLVQNGDRHHHEFREKRLMLIDNGKGLGNPFVNFVDILAPLYQCCMLRRSTYDSLQNWTGGKLTETLRQLTKYDLLDPILNEAHWKATERRLLIIFSAIDLCLRDKGDAMFC